MYSVIRTDNVRAYVPIPDDPLPTYELNITEFEGRGGAVRAFMERETLLDLQKQLNHIFQRNFIIGEIKIEKVSSSEEKANE